MSLVKEWAAAKKAFDTEVKDQAKIIAKMEKELGKIKKKGSKEDVAWQKLLISNKKQEKVKRAKSGMTPVLRFYDDLLKKMEALKNKGVPGSKKKVWKPLTDELGKGKKALAKAVINVRNQHLVLQKENVAVKSYLTNIENSQAKKTGGQLIAKNTACQRLVNDALLMTRRIDDRLDVLLQYLRKDMKNW